MLRSVGDQVGARASVPVPPLPRAIAGPAVGTAVPDGHGADLVERLRLHWASDLPGAAALTLRERQCLLLVADGWSDGAIAAVLDLSRPTVATHMMNARTKLNARTRAQAVARFILGAMRESLSGSR